jgi:hypothetical protein
MAWKWTGTLPNNENIGRGNSNKGMGKQNFTKETRKFRKRIQNKQPKKILIRIRNKTKNKHPTHSHS